MLIEEIKKMDNPYRISSQIDQSSFIGRKKETEQLRSMLEAHNNGLPVSHIIITGEKSIGKSSLLNRYKQIFQDYNFVVYDYEISRDTENKIDEFEFFKDLIGYLFEKYAPPENHFFDTTQSDIWFSLTRDKYNHDSDYKDREISFATKYANKRKGIEEKISLKELEADFSRIMKNILSEEMQFSGFAILIDEFQELFRNVGLLDILRQLVEKIPHLVIVGAGMPNFLENPIFEKMARISRIVNLKNLQKNEVLDLIFKPLQSKGRLTGYESEQCFDKESIFEIVIRTNGNPLHVQVLCQNMFEYFRRSPDLEKIELNSEVMEMVMEYYATISEKSKKIKNSLSTCSRDKLMAFSYLYRYEGFTLHAVIIGELAFNSINKENEDRIRRKLFESFKEIKDLQLFEFSGERAKLDELEFYSIDKLANVEYKFIGDTIDSLYAAYYYERLTEKKLSRYSDKSFEDFLAWKLGRTLNFEIIKRKVKDVIDIDKMLLGVETEFGTKSATHEDIAKDLDYLVKASSDKNIDDEDKKQINLISDKYHLSYPSAYMHMFGYEGYLVLFSSVTIRGKNRLIVNFYPIKGNISDICEKKKQIINYTDYIQNPLDEYLIKINWVYLYWLPKQPLIEIFFLDLTKMTGSLLEIARRREFEKAVSIAEFIHKIDMRVEEKSVFASAQAANNYAFCLINNNDLKNAKKYLESIKDKYLLGGINLAYIYYIENNNEEALKILKKIFRKKMGEKDKIDLINLALNHPKLPINNRIAEDITMYQIACFNLALIYAQQKESPYTISLFLKKTDAQGNTKLVEKRVKNWIEYYSNGPESALKNCEKILEDCKSINYLYADVLKDREIFKEEIHQVKLLEKK